MAHEVCGSIGDIMKVKDLEKEIGKYIEIKEHTEGSVSIVQLMGITCNEEDIVSQVIIRRTPEGLPKDAEYIPISRFVKVTDQ